MVSIQTREVTVMDTATAMDMAMVMDTATAMDMVMGMGMDIMMKM